MGSRLLTLMAPLLIALLLIACGGAPKSESYQQGLAAQQTNDLEAALKKFEAAGDYGDAKQRVVAIQQALVPVRQTYDEAARAVKAEDWTKAEPQLRSIVDRYPNFRDAQKLHDQTIQELNNIIANANKKLESGDVSGAAATLAQAGDYDQASKRAQDLTTAAGAYEKGAKALESKDLWTAYSQLDIAVKLAPGFRAADEKLAATKQQLDAITGEADRKAEAGDYEGAVALYKSAGGYKQSDRRATQLDTLRARLDQLYGVMNSSENAREWPRALDAAADILKEAPKYRDVAAKRSTYLEQIYALGSTALSENNPKEAIRLFSILIERERNYKDANEKLGAARIAARPTPGTIVYRADWSQGLGSWNGSSDWRVVANTLVNDGSRAGRPASTIKAPYNLEDMADYAVEIEAQLVRFRENGRTNPGFGITARSDYHGGLDVYERDRSKSVVISTDWTGQSNNIGKGEYRPDEEWHTYRFEVKGNSLRFLVDGRVYASGTDNRYLSPGYVGVWSDTTQINIRAFRIIAQ